MGTDQQSIQPALYWHFRLHLPSWSSLFQMSWPSRPTNRADWSNVKRMSWLVFVSGRKAERSSCSPMILKTKGTVSGRKSVKGRVNSMESSWPQIAKNEFSGLLQRSFIVLMEEIIFFLTNLLAVSIQLNSLAGVRNSNSLKMNWKRQVYGTKLSRSGGDLKCFCPCQYHQMTFNINTCLEDQSSTRSQKNHLWPNMKSRLALLMVKV